MAAALRITCSLCGDAEVSFSAARLLVSVDTGEMSNTLEFDCPECGHTEHRWLDEFSARLLLTAGIDVAVAMPALGSSRLQPLIDLRSPQISRPSGGDRPSHTRWQDRSDWLCP